MVGFLGTIFSNDYICTLLLLYRIGAAVLCSDTRTAIATRHLVIATRWYTYTHIMYRTSVFRLSCICEQNIEKFPCSLQPKSLARQGSGSHAHALAGALAGAPAASHAAANAELAALRG